MRNLLIMTMLMLTMFPAVAAPDPSTNVAIFNGVIDDETVDEFLRKYGKRTDLTEFSVASEGGELLASIRLAKWIRLKNLNVRVRVMCNSACANYVFIAGREKIIENGASVAWHGDAEQMDFREMVASYRKLVVTQNDGGKLTRAEVAHLKEHKMRFVGLVKAQHAQSDFYQSVGVDPRMGRFGQEPISYPSDGWTFTVRAMKLLRINNVSAPEKYGSNIYFRDIATHATMVNGGPLLVFDSLDGKNIVSIPLQH